MAPNALTGAAAAPLASGVLAMLILFLILGAAGGAATPPAGAVLCGAGGTQQAIEGTTLSADQMANAAIIVSVTAARHLPAYAATIALTTAYTESTLHNYTTQTDHDSEGLFQQRVSIYTAAVAADPVKATTAFLARLTSIPNWQHNPVGVDAQAVQISKFPDRYATHQALGYALTNLLWPAAINAAPGTSNTVSTDEITPAVACSGDGANPSEGHHGDVVAGSPSIPAGLVVVGSPAARTAVKYALEQLGKLYRFGAAGPNAFDCSGLTMAVWATAGVPLPHLAAAQAAAGTPEPLNLSQAGPGDLVMIPGSDGTPARPGHVGMIIGTAADGHLYLIQAPGWNNLPIEVTDTSEWVGDIVDVRHIA